jgi:predicted nucleic acid-binding protein
MTAPVFVDTNVLLYADQIDAPLKQPVARQWLERLWKERTGRTSIQVLNEYYWSATHKIRPRLSPDEAWARLHSLLTWNPQPIDRGVIVRAHDIERRYGLSWWDSLIVGAAQAQSCGLLLTEDLQDRAIYGGVTIRNPFTLGVSEAAAQYTVTPVSNRRYRPRGRPSSRATAAAVGKP